MPRLYLLGKRLTTVAFVLGAIAWLWAVIADDRTAPTIAFVSCCLVGVIGIVLAVCFMPEEKLPNISWAGMRLAMIGFAVAAIPTIIGAFLFGQSDDEIAPFFWSGFAIVVAGIALHGWYVLKHLVERR